MSCGSERRKLIASGIRETLPPKGWWLLEHLTDPQHADKEAALRAARLDAVFYTFDANDFNLLIEIIEDHLRAIPESKH